MIESRPRKGYPVPSTSSSCSVLLESLDSSDAYHSSSTPMRTQHPASSGAKRARRRAGCWTPEQDEKGSPSRNLTLKQRSYEVSKSCGKHHIDILLEFDVICCPSFMYFIFFNHFLCRHPCDPCIIAPLVGRSGWTTSPPPAWTWVQLCNLSSQMP